MRTWNPWTDPDLPIRKGKDGESVLQHDDGPVVVRGAFPSSLNGEKRRAFWEGICQRRDLEFWIPIREVRRFCDMLPEDWGGGYAHVTLVYVLQSQKQADRELSAFCGLAACRRVISAEPLTEPLCLESYLAGGKIARVLCGGEAGEKGRLCRYEWVLDLREQCVRQETGFRFLRTGTNFQKGEKRYRIAEAIQRSQAEKAGIDYEPPSKEAEEMERLFCRLSASKFRGGFRLGPKEAGYAEEKGRDTIRFHARDFVSSRLAPAEIPNDGRQTPMRGHPVFLAQHATGTCCRGCLAKWHHMEKGRQLSEREQEYIVSVICEWIERQMKRQGRRY